MFPKTRHLLRAVSIVLLQCFALQQIAFADVIKPATQDPLSKPMVSLDLPETVASIEDAYKSTVHGPQSTERMIYLLQDAHTNESAQYNLAKALDIILKKESGPQSTVHSPQQADRDGLSTIDRGLKYVFTEAGIGDNSLSFLRPFRPLSERVQLAKSYTKKGILHGAEYLDLTSDHSFILWGVENPTLYLKAIQDYKHVASERPRFEIYLKKIAATLDTLNNRLLNPALQEFLKESKLYHQDKLALTEYFQALQREATLHNLDMKRYPHLNKLKDLKSQEEKIDFQKANEEHLKAVQSLPQDIQQELKELSQVKAGKILQNKKEERAYFAYLEEKLDVNYPELTKYFEYLKSAKDIQAKDILSELKAFEQEVFNTLGKSEDEKSLIKAQESLRYLNKLFSFTLTPEEFKSSDFNIEHLTGFLNKKILDLETYYERSLFLEKGYEEMIEKAISFYQLTFERDEYFLEQALTKMDQENQTKAALITGGFHTTNLKELLKKKNISYVSITPQVLQETNLKKYESILLDQIQDLKTPQLSMKPIASTAMTAMLLSPALGNAVLSQRAITDFANGSSLSTVHSPQTTASNGLPLTTSEFASSGARLARVPSDEVIQQKVIALLSESLGIEIDDISLSSELEANLGADSLDQEEILGLLDETFEGFEDLFASHAYERGFPERITVQQIILLVKQEITKRASAGARLAGEEEASTVHRPQTTAISSLPSTGDRGLSTGQTSGARLASGKSLWETDVPKGLPLISIAVSFFFAHLPVSVRVMSQLGNPVPDVFFIIATLFMMVLMTGSQPDPRAGYYDEEPDTYFEATIKTGIVSLYGAAIGFIYGPVLSGLELLPTQAEAVAKEMALTGFAAAFLPTFLLQSTWALVSSYKAELHAKKENGARLSDEKETRRLESVDVDLSAIERVTAKPGLPYFAFLRQIRADVDRVKAGEISRGELYRRILPYVRNETIAHALVRTFLSSGESFYNENLGDSGSGQQTGWNGEGVAASADLLQYVERMLRLPEHHPTSKRLRRTINAAKKDSAKDSSEAAYNASVLLIEDMVDHADPTIASWTPWVEQASDAFIGRAIYDPGARAKLFQLRHQFPKFYIELLMHLDDPAAPLSDHAIRKLTQLQLLKDGRLIPEVMMQKAYLKSLLDVDGPAKPAEGSRLSSLEGVQIKIVGDVNEADRSLVNYLFEIPDKRSLSLEDLFPLIIETENKAREGSDLPQVDRSYIQDFAVDNSREFLEESPEFIVISDWMSVAITWANAPLSEPRPFDDQAMIDAAPHNNFVYLKEKRTLSGLAAIFMPAAWYGSYKVWSYLGASEGSSIWISVLNILLSLSTAFFLTRYVVREALTSADIVLVLGDREIELDRHFSVLKLSNALVEWGKQIPAAEDMIFITDSQHLGIIERDSLLFQMDFGDRDNRMENLSKLVTELNRIAGARLAGELPPADQFFALRDKKPSKRGADYFPVGDKVAVHILNEHMKSEPVKKLIALLISKNAYSEAVDGGVVFQAEVVSGTSFTPEGYVRFAYLTRDGQKIVHGSKPITSAYIGKWLDPKTAFFAPSLALVPTTRLVRKDGQIGLLNRSFKIGKGYAGETVNIQPLNETDFEIRLASKLIVTYVFSEGEYKAVWPDTLIEQQRVPTVNPAAVSAQQVADALKDRVALWKKSVSRIGIFGHHYPIRIILDKTGTPVRILDYIESFKMWAYEAKFDPATGQIHQASMTDEYRRLSPDPQVVKAFDQGVALYNQSYAGSFAQPDAVRTLPMKGARLAGDEKTSIVHSPQTTAINSLPLTVDRGLSTVSGFLIGSAQAQSIGTSVNEISILLDPSQATIFELSLKGNELIVNQRGGKKLGVLTISSVDRNDKGIATSVKVGVAEAISLINLNTQSVQAALGPLANLETITPTLTVVHLDQFGDLQTDPLALDLYLMTAAQIADGLKNKDALRFTLYSQDKHLLDAALLRLASLEQKHSFVRGKFVAATTLAGYTSVNSLTPASEVAEIGQRALRVQALEAGDISNPTVQILLAAAVAQEEPGESLSAYLIKGVEAATGQPVVPQELSDVIWNRADIQLMQKYAIKPILQKIGQTLQILRMQMKQVAQAA